MQRWRSTQQLAPKELPNPDPQHPRDAVDVDQADVDLAPLDAAEAGAVEAARQSDGFLGELAGLAELAEAGAEAAFDLLLTRFVHAAAERNVAE
jgi:hypothetical protein